MESIILNKRSCRKNKLIKVNQKYNQKKYKHNGKSELKGKLNKLFNTDLYSYANLAQTVKGTEPIIASSNQLIDLVKKNNIVGLSGSNSDTSLKLDAINKYKGEKILIVNAYECDPGLLNDMYVLDNRKNDLIQGIKILTRVFDFKKIYVPNKDYEEKIGNVSFVKLANRFPLGYEKYLIKELLNREVNTYPTDGGILVLNSQTVLKIYELSIGVIFNSRYVTVANINEGVATVINAPLGESIATIAKKVYPNRCGNIYSGTGAMHVCLANDNVVETTTAFIAIGDAYIAKDNSCAGCGVCSKNCPAKVDIRGVIKKISKKENVTKDMLNINKCIGCGMCSYVCPREKDLRGIIASIKNK